MKEKQKRKKQSTNALQVAFIDSETKLHHIIDALPDGIAITDKDLTILEANEAAVRLVGFTKKEDLIGRKGLDFISPEYIGPISDSFLNALDGRPDQQVELTIIDASGQEVDVGLSISLLNDQAGNLTGFLVAVRDITGRRRAEEALRISETRYRELFENMSSGVVVYEAINDGKDFIFKDFNSVAERISRLNREDLIGKSVLETKPGLKKFGLFDMMQKVWRTGKPEHMPVSYYEDEHVSGWRENFIYKLPSGEVVAVYNDITERKQAEEALKESGERLRNIFDSAYEGIMVTDPMGNIIEANENVLHLHGYKSKEELFKINSIKLIAKKDRARLAQDSANAIKGGRSFKGEYLLLRADGTEFEAECHMSVMYDSAGKPVGLVGVSHDITARRKSEEALRESEEKLRFMFESMGDAIVVIDLKGKVIEVNERLIAMSGYESREEVLGEMPLNSLLRGFALGQWKISRTAERQVSTTVEYVAVDRYGREFDVEASGAVLRDAVGKPAGFIIALRDVSDRKRMEKALRESEEKLRLTFDSMGEMLMLLDLKGNIVDVNPVLAHTMGYSRKEDLIGRSAADLVIESERSKVIEYTIESIKRGLVTGKSGYRNLKLKTADGKALEAEYSITLMRDKNGRLSGVIGVGRDITERRRAEEAIRLRNIELTAIARVTQSLSQQLKLNRVLQTALDKILEVSGLSVGAIWLLDDEKKVLKLAISRGVSNKFIKAVSKMPLDVGITARATEIGRTVVVTDVQRDKKLPPKYKATAKLEKLQSVVSIPLKSKGKVLGAMNVFSRERFHFSADVLRLLETISGQIGIAIDNAQLLEKLSELSKTDELTGLYNRRTFFEMLDAEISHSSRYSRPFSLVMLDLDNFKSFNDRFGHTSGDAALRKFGTAMKSALRKADAAFRYGGDEFTIILPSTEAKKSRRIIERTRTKWLQAQYNQYPNAEITIDFSVGIAQYPDDTETIDGLIFLADTALLIAKREGGYKSTLVSELGQLPPDVLGTTTLDQVYKLAATVDAKSLYAEGHSKRVAIVAETIGKHMGLDEKQLSQLRVAALLHDIGKIGVPDLIMSKPYGLSKDERRVMEKHPSEGAKILSHVRELAAIVPIVLHHHEWYNGAGYPDRLKTEAIPFLSRILTIADSYDTMTTPLPHKKAMTHEEAAEELRRYSGMQFDPEIVEGFCRNVSADDIRGQI